MFVGLLHLMKLILCEDKADTRSEETSDLEAE